MALNISVTAHKEMKIFYDKERKMKTELDKELMHSVEDVRKRVSEVRNLPYPFDEIKPEEETKEMTKKVIHRIKSFENIHKDLTPAEEMSLLQEGIFASMIRTMKANKK